MKAALAGLTAAVVAVVGAVAGVGLVAGVARAQGAAPPSAAALAEIPAELVGVYQEAAGAACEGLPWQVLAGIGWAESRHGGGRADPATGDVGAPPILGPPIDGRPGFAAIPDPESPDGWAHALGPMQFLSTTWDRWATLAPGRPPGAAPSPHNARDAIHAAGRMLCGGRAEMGDLREAILSYNRSEAYHDEVWAKALAYGMAWDGSTGVGLAAGPVAVPGPGRLHAGDVGVVVEAAHAQLGVPYVWGGKTPGAKLDCSGLTHVAYRAAGVELPHGTANQVSVGVAVPAAEARPGDLLFSRGGRPTRDLGHVALYVGDGLMVVAPRTGEVVSLRKVPWGAVQTVRRVLLP